MIDLHRILIPTDFSKHSQNALAYAAAFAEKFGAELHLLHVVQDLALFIPDAITGSGKNVPRSWTTCSSTSLAPNFSARAAA